MELNSIQFKYQDNGVYHTIHAHNGDPTDPTTRVGTIDWVKPTKKAARATEMEPGEVAGVWAQPQRQGIGTALWQHAKEMDPKIRHSSSQTKRGAAWAKKVGD